MDTLYTGDIPNNFNYASFGNGYIDLFSTDTSDGTTLNFYRIYTNCNGFYYSQGSRLLEENETLTEITTSDKIYYRNDYSNILLCTFIITLFFIFLTNIITSLIRRGGILGGLL